MYAKQLPLTIYVLTLVFIAQAISILECRQTSRKTHNLTDHFTHDVATQLLLSSIIMYMYIYLAPFTLEIHMKLCDCPACSLRVAPYFKSEFCKIEHILYTEIVI